MAAFTDEPQGGAVRAGVRAPEIRPDGSDTDTIDAHRVQHYRNEARDFHARLTRAEGILAQEQKVLARVDQIIGNPSSMLLGGGFPTATFGMLLHASTLTICGLAVLAAGLMSASVWGITRAVILQRCAEHELECARWRQKSQDYDGLVQTITTSAAHRLSQLTNHAG